MAFTYFFRDLQTLELVAEHLVPFVSGRSSVRIWDAGCASGEEPYTMAIILAEKMGRFAYKNVKFFATDIDISDQFEKIIKNGIYPYDLLQRIPKELFEKYFQPVDSAKSGEKSFQIDQIIRDRMNFIRSDLLKLDAPSDEFSLVICKNVLLHFQYNERIEVIKMFHKSLSAGGFLAMEHTQKMPDECAHLFEPVVSNAQLYKKKQD